MVPFFLWFFSFWYRPNSTVPVCPSFVCFCKQGWYLIDYFFKNLCLMFVCFVLFLYWDWFCRLWRILQFHDFCAEYVGDRLILVSSLYVGLCRWLGSKHKPTYCMYIVLYRHLSASYLCVWQPFVLCRCQHFIVFHVCTAGFFSVLMSTCLRFMVVLPFLLC